MKLIITDTNIFFDKAKGIKLLELLKEVNFSLPFDEIDKLIRSYKK